MGLFKASPVLSAVAVPGQSSGAPDDQEDWADLDLGIPERRPVAHNSRSHASRDEGEDLMPEISTIPRPEELLRKAPYWMVVKQMSPTLVIINGSHTPSLACLDEYLRRWCRGEVNRVNRVCTPSSTFFYTDCGFD
jgi:hypothetical protein